MAKTKIVSSLNLPCPSCNNPIRVGSQNWGCLGLIICITPIFFLAPFLFFIDFTIDLMLMMRVPKDVVGKYLDIFPAVKHECHWCKASIKVKNSKFLHSDDTFHIE
jgi:hypothetical protein